MQLINKENMEFYEIIATTLKVERFLSDHLQW